MADALIKAITGEGADKRDQLPPVLRRTVPLPPVTPVSPVVVPTQFDFPPQPETPVVP